ncbi:hypothetical protein DDZ14_08600 [Maritimibacter sp. 55A14]|uniref:hypothetical protein n=1 Tax=Maritimibacter sp. 55A14 TaxID=2174844 RepID=UPI000D61AB40|nr:hypothetical protein [Maritimibacter sp. 55A14]PWE32795.1 hypothetical protein DDZ14_08600 [Maritimibacter sp. 55A14]
MLTRWALIGAGTLVVLLAGGLWLQSDRVDRLRTENASLTRSVAALQMQAEQAALAREVEAARAERDRARAAEAQATIEAILTGDFEDEPLPPGLADILNGLRDHATD